MHDWLKLFHAGQAAFPPTEVAVKIAIALSLGLLVGFEREWANKDIGVRTFALTSLLGLLGALTAQPLAVVAGVGILVLVATLNLCSIRTTRKLEATTSVALLAVFLLGALVGEGHIFTPVACSIVVTMLLALKPQFRSFAGGLRPEEVRSAILLGLLGFVIWPLLPARFIDPWKLLNPREAWIAVVVIACLGFINYVLLRVYGSKGLYVTAILGGMVNSTATVAEMVSSLARGELMAATVPVIMLTSVAMYARNLLILALFSRGSVRFAALPMIGMGIAAAFWTYRRLKITRDTDTDLKLSLGSPVSLKRVLTFAGLFLGIQIFAALAQRMFGASGLQTISVLGGLVSSASTTAAAADLVMRGKIAASQAGIATVLTSIASLGIDLPIVHRQVRDKSIVRDLYTASLVQAAVGIAVLSIQGQIFHAL